jgi:hypothetical protein
MSTAGNTSGPNKRRLKLLLDACELCALELRTIEFWQPAGVAAMSK